MPFSFEARFEDIDADMDAYVDAVFECLDSEFMIMPRGKGFIEFPIFEAGYEALKLGTRGFRDVTSEVVAPIVFETPISLIVLRCMLGFSASEWAYYASRREGVAIGQDAVRTIDRNIRINPRKALPERRSAMGRRVMALTSAACHLLKVGKLQAPTGSIHRLDKADTMSGLASLRSISKLGAPYSVLLYERFLGRPFAGHRDSVSELVGNVVENAIENVLSQADISFRKTGRAEKLPNFDQAPDFVVPSEFNPQVIIEAKLAEDDGTARDKVTRIQHLGALSMEGQLPGQPKFEVVACIAGRGFGVRREDMRKLLLATRGKVFTLQNMGQLVEHTRLSEFRPR